MRKVTLQILVAFLQGKTRTVGNTWTNGEIIRLHGNIIIKRESDQILWGFGGFPSMTTKERLSPFVGIWRKNWEWHSDTPEGTPIPEEKAKEIETLQAIAKGDIGKIRAIRAKEGDENFPECLPYHWSKVANEAKQEDIKQYIDSIIGK